ncbi:hypothetical protein TrCOL_g10754 [Triparma columacea]|uniref:Uncharacterized protein n=1 Tax=Triparma columacea TaxID=722753 RepID=A0A9W7G0L5_9STRA|nr:hypothetical protein TrCOL_g10754 [Triparma columacea]
MDKIRDLNVSYVHFGQPCRYWTRLNLANGMTREETHPMGIHQKKAKKKSNKVQKNDLALKERAANFQMQIFSNIVNQLQQHYPEVAFSLENGTSTFIWDTPQMKTIAEHKAVKKYNFDCCAYGAPFKKKTSWLTNSPLLSDLKVAKCNCQIDNHVRVEGSNAERAAAYFPSFCFHLAMLMMVGGGFTEIEITTDLNNELWKNMTDNQHEGVRESLNRLASESLNRLATKRPETTPMPITSPAWGEINLEDELTKHKSVLGENEANAFDLEKGTRKHGLQKEVEEFCSICGYEQDEDENRVNEGGCTGCPKTFHNHRNCMQYLCGGNRVTGRGWKKDAGVEVDKWTCAQCQSDSDPEEEEE